jgi:hypothetical protein
MAIQNINKISLREGETSVNRDTLLNVSKIVPFNLGIMELLSRHEGDLPRYRLILVNTQNYGIFPTLAQQEKARADRLEKELEQYQRKI